MDSAVAPCWIFDKGAGDVREAHLDTESILLISRAVIFSVSEEDARLEGRPGATLFAERKQAVLNAVASYRASRSFAVLVRSVTLAAGSLLLAILRLVLLHKAYRKIANGVDAVLATRSHEKGLGSLYRVFVDPLILLARLGLRIGFLSIALTILLSLVSFDLSLFPATMGLSGAVASQVGTLLGTLAGNFVAYLPNLAVLVLVALFTYGMIWVAGTLAQAVETGSITLAGFHKDWAKPTSDLVKILLGLFALVVAFS